MIYINEWFPNPIGTDTCKANCGWNVEWVELYNSGDAPVSLSGWSLWTGGKTKPVPLGGIVPAHGYAMLKKPDIKISLKNTDGGLWLYGPEGKLVDHAAFKGAAPEGKSFSRVLYNSATDNVPGATSAGANIQAFAFVNPTPGARNQKINNQVAVQHHPTGTPLNPPITGMEIAGLAFGAALTIFAAWAYVIKTNEAISNIIFPRNAGDRGIDRAPY
ncbi:MAG TPA: lamin tail domain-containing protein [Candidatus Paceibacterota bacterium]|nr:lamin tail domain-containing protein [Candidatus Paceibacterota bacterium]